MIPRFVCVFWGEGESEEFWRYWGCPHFEAHVMEFKRFGGPLSVIEIERKSNLLILTQSPNLDVHISLLRSSLMPGVPGYHRRTMNI